MAFDLKQATLKAFLVPNHTQVNIKLRGEDTPLEGWAYRGFDNDQMFILITKDTRSRWLPVSSISYIEQINENN